jgi:hypothetical protein
MKKNNMKKMDKIKKIVNTPWFRSALAGLVALGLVIKGELFYAGIAIGIGVREFLLAFKS